MIKKLNEKYCHFWKDRCLLTQVQNNALTQFQKGSICFSFHTGISFLKIWKFNIAPWIGMSQCLNDHHHYHPLVWFASKSSLFQSYIAPFFPSFSVVETLKIVIFGYLLFSLLLHWGVSRLKSITARAKKCLIFPFIIVRWLQSPSEETKTEKKRYFSWL